MKKLVGVAAAAVVLCSATAFADPSGEPMDRAIEKVSENLAEHPDNRGLRNARQRLQDNQVRQSTRGRNQAPGQQRESSSAEDIESPAGAERAQLPDRVEAVGRPDRPGRPDTVGRPERLGGLDLPGRNR